MIHTIELQKQIPNAVFYNLNEKRPVEERWNNRIIVHCDKKGLMTTDIRKGIKKVTIQKVKTSEDSVETTWLFLQLNASALLGFAEPRKPIRITKAHLDRLEERIKKVEKDVLVMILKETGVDCLNWGLDFRIRRIDYAIDISLAKADRVDEYIRLLHKGYNNRWIKRRNDKKNYYASNDAKQKKYRRAVNCYNKTRFEKEKGNSSVATNLLRFEVQLGYKQIEKYADLHRRKNYIDYKDGSLYSRLFELSEDVLKDYCLKISEPMPYYHKKTILSMMRERDISERQIQQLEEYLIEITKKGACLTKFKKKYNNSIQLLKENNINPVPLSTRVSGENIDSIYQIIEKHFSISKEAQSGMEAKTTRRKVAKKRIKVHKK